MDGNAARKWEQAYTSYIPKKEEQTSTVTVKQKRWITKGEKVLYSAIGFLLIAACIYVVSFASATDTLNRKVESLEQSIQQQKVTNEALLYEKKQLSRPERITRIAKENGLKIQESKVKQAQAYNSN
ncbi:cell division protein FtsL [Lentibacillus cibarius]|uniref:Cell division protein FtsL n=1 Tax=Lentibacillus cibarius TaxID=2583219 RepID=A0A549YKA9_9BACI|nr:cell division protein FtsL [Lentibacillus cibarius]TRM12304.1 cell division protein FtsL [Lentibacillus cibarius]